MVNESFGRSGRPTSSYPHTAAYISLGFGLALKGTSLPVSVIICSQHIHSLGCIQKLGSSPWSLTIATGEGTTISLNNGRDCDLIEERGVARPAILPAMVGSPCSQSQRGWQRGLTTSVGEPTRLLPNSGRDCTNDHLIASIGGLV